MAQRSRVVFMDDLTGEEFGDNSDTGKTGECVSFSLDGMAYELDLTDVNAATLREALAPYVQAGRKMRTLGASAKKSASAAGAKAPNEVRAWAIANGYKVAKRGRIPADIKAAFVSQTPASRALKSVS